MAISSVKGDCLWRPGALNSAAGDGRLAGVAAKPYEMGACSDIDFDGLDGGNSPGRWIRLKNYGSKQGKNDSAGT